MLDNNMHLKLIDFASAKIQGKTFDQNTMRFEDEEQNTNSNHNSTHNDNGSDGDYCGQKRAINFIDTAEYVSQEMLKD